MANQYPLFISSYENFPGASNSLDQALSFYTTTAVLNSELAAKVDVTSGTATNLTVNTGMRLPFAATGILQVDGSGNVSGGGGVGAGATLAGNNTFTGTNNFTNGLAQNGNAFSIGGAFTTTPANALTLTTAGATNVTLPTTGTLAALNGTNTWTGANAINAAFTVSSATGFNQIQSTNTGSALNVFGSSSNSGKTVIAISSNSASAGSQRQLWLGQVNGSFNNTGGGGYIGALAQGVGQIPIYIDTGTRSCFFNKANTALSNQNDSAIYGNGTAIVAFGNVVAAGTPQFQFQNTVGTALFTSLTNTTTTTTNKTINFPDASGQVALGTAGNPIFFTTVGATALSLPPSGNVPSGTSGNAINFTTTGVTTLTLPTTGTVATLEGNNTWSTSNNFQGTLQQAGRGLILGSGTDSLAIQTAGNTIVALPTSGTLASLSGNQTWSGTQNFAQTGLVQNGRMLVLGSNTDSLQIQTSGNTNVILPTSGTLSTTTAANTWSSTNNFTGGLSQNGNALSVGGALTTGAAFTTTPANALTLTTAGATNVTLPTGGTLAALGNTNAWTGANTWSGASTFNTPTIVALDSVSYGTSVLQVRNATNTNNQLYMGFNSSTNASYIQSITQGTSTRPMVLNPSGGNVCINSTSSPISLASSFTTSGANALTLTTTGATNVTLPTSGTLITSATGGSLSGNNTWTGTNTFSNSTTLNGSINTNLAVSSTGALSYALNYAFPFPPLKLSAVVRSTYAISGSTSPFTIGALIDSEGSGQQLVTNPTSQTLGLAINPIVCSHWIIEGTMRLSTPATSFATITVSATQGIGSSTSLNPFDTAGTAPATSSFVQYNAGSSAVLSQSFYCVLSDSIGGVINVSFLSGTVSGASNGVVTVTSHYTV